MDVQSHLFLDEKILRAEQRVRLFFRFIWAESGSGSIHSVAIHFGEMSHPLPLESTSCKILPTTGCTSIIIPVDS